MVRKLIFSEENGLNRGYLSFLGTIGKSSFVKVSTNSSSTNEIYDTNYAIDGDWNTKYSSKRESNYYQWLQIHFTTKPILITAYSMLYTNIIQYNCYPYHWKITGSNDGIHFSEIDSQPGNDILKDNQPHVFQVDISKQNQYSYFRIINTGNHPITDCDGILYVNEFELFGSVYYQVNSSKCFSKTNLVFLFLSINMK